MGPVTKLLLVRHAQPLMDGETPRTEWPLTENGKNAAIALGKRVAGRSPHEIVWTSPERRALETAALTFPFVTAERRDQLCEVKKPWYASADAHADAVSDYLTGKVVKGWEHRQAVIARIAQLQLDFGSVDSIVVVSHGLFITTWLDHEIGLNDPYSFWSTLQMPDALELDLDEKSFRRIS
jgi:broad specificity phosphatase PhoE